MNSKKQNRIALIDIEFLLYAHAAKAEGEPWTYFEQVVDDVQERIGKIKDDCHASEHYLVVSGRHNFRKVLYPDYKAGRPPKPAIYHELSKSIEELNKGKWLYHDQLEADDLLGIMLTNGRVENPICCSIDKDLLTVPGCHYNWKKDVWPREVTQRQADVNWLIQLLTGDATDKIRGIKGIGDVKAKKLIEKHKFEEHYKSENIPEIAKLIYESEGISLDDYYKTLYLISIWRKPMPEALMENELIAEIAKTISSL